MNFCIEKWTFIVGGFLKYVLIGKCVLLNKGFVINNNKIVLSLICDIDN